MYINVNVAIDEVLSELSDEDLRQEYNSRFSSPGSDWNVIRDARRAKSPQDFLAYLDVIIMDKTGCIL